MTTRAPRKLDRYPLLTFHRSGFTAYHSPAPNVTSTLSGYDSPESFAETLGSREEAERFEGTIVLDKREAVERRPGDVVSSPMVDVRLAPGEVSRFAEYVRGLSASHRESVGTMLGALPETAMPGLAALALADDDFGGLDYVSVPAYVAWWQSRGARVGIVQDGRIAWAS